MKYAEYQHLFRIGRVGLIDNNIGQAAHHLFMGTRYATEMSHARKFSQLLGSETDASDHLRSCDGISISDVAVNCGNVLARFRGEAQL